MVSGISIALFVGIPVAVIVGLGLLANTFRSQILGSASALGEVFGGVFTNPVRGFIDQISGAFSDLPDIDINVPSLNIQGGGVNIGDPNGNGGGFELPNLCNVFGIGCDEPGPGPMEEPGPTPGPGPEVDQPLFGGAFAQFFNVQTSEGIQRLSFEELQATQPGAVVGLFDVLGTQETEFLPLNVEQVQASLEAGQRLRLSGQVFQDIRGIKNVQDLF